MVAWAIYIGLRIAWVEGVGLGQGQANAPVRSLPSEHLIADSALVESKGFGLPLFSLHPRRSLPGLVKGAKAEKKAPQVFRLGGIARADFFKKLLGPKFWHS